MVTAKLICTFVFAYAESKYSHEAALVQNISVPVWQMHQTAGYTD